MLLLDVIYKYPTRLRNIYGNFVTIIVFNTFCYIVGFKVATTLLLSYGDFPAFTGGERPRVHYFTKDGSEVTRLHVLK